MKKKGTERLKAMSPLKVMARNTIFNDDRNEAQNVRTKLRRSRIASPR